MSFMSFFGTDIKVGDLVLCKYRIERRPNSPLKNMQLPVEGQYYFVRAVKKQGHASDYFGSYYLLFEELENEIINDVVGELAFPAICFIKVDSAENTIEL